MMSTLPYRCVPGAPSPDAAQEDIQSHSDRGCFLFRFALLVKVSCLRNFQNLELFCDVVAVGSEVTMRARIELSTMWPSWYASLVKVSYLSKFLNLERLDLSYKCLTSLEINGSLERRAIQSLMARGSIKMSASMGLDVMTRLCYEEWIDYILVLGCPGMHVIQLLKGELGTHELMGRASKLRPPLFGA
ncbi:hypothetical protein M5K25_012375 [Dendrobium thyrsiflorum]|uniref:Uncharacterized protein n=1 Tax=Dendrobium thyrsiflorum TaxID=117978 RepID=A0ABD0UX04_DENTH